MSKKERSQRAKEFLSCLGNGKTIYQCEAENDLIDKKIEVKNGKRTD